MPPDVRRSRADLRSTHATDHLIARAAAIEATNLRARKQRTDQVCQTIANPPYFQRRHPTQACKILYSRSPRVRYAARAKQFCNWLIGHRGFVVRRAVVFNKRWRAIEKELHRDLQDLGNLLQ